MLCQNCSIVAILTIKKMPSVTLWGQYPVLAYILDPSRFLLDTAFESLLGSNLYSGFLMG